VKTIIALRLYEAKYCWINGDSEPTREYTQTQTHVLKGMIASGNTARKTNELTACFLIF